ncbi:MAG: histidine kinase, gyrase and HSP90-like ATPase family protein [Betaproteobacteria bacterium]|nr:histidine kinase, gyrase and HSP90-like ATPase family protein [Betaproteobacteria bacterium]
MHATLPRIHFNRGHLKMSFRNLLRSPYSIGLALTAITAAVLKKKAVSRSNAADAPQQAAQDCEVRNEELTRLSHGLLVAGEEEKARIARELHDGLGSTLTAVNLDLYWVQQRLADNPALAGRLGRAIEVLASTVEIKRRIIHALRPAALDNLGLSLAIESHLAEFEKTSPATIKMDLPAEFPTLTAQASIALFRIFEEALTNAGDREGATSIEVSLRKQDGGASIEIADDGKAEKFDPASAASFNLLAMREHAAAFDGTLSVTRRAGKRGTLVRAFFPHPFREPAEPLPGEL